MQHFVELVGANDRCFKLVTAPKKKRAGSGEVRTRADFRPLGFRTVLKSNALDQLGHATNRQVVPEDHHKIQKG